MATGAVTLCVVLRVPPQGLEMFQAYEDHVLPLLARHGGDLQRRLRSKDGLTEVHVIRFPSTDSFDRFRADPDRARHNDLMVRSGAVAEILRVEDV